MFRITIDNEEVLCDKDITIKKEMLNTPSVILNNVFPKTWESSKDYTTNFYHPNDYSKCVIADEDYIEESDGTTVEGSNLSINYDDRRNFEYNLKGDTYQYTTTGKNLLTNTNGTTQTINGLTFTKNSDGTVKVNGTSTANTNYYIDGNENNWTTATSGTYYLSDSTPNPTSTTYFTYMDARHLDDSAWDTMYLNTSQQKTRTISDGFKFRGRIVVRSGVAMNNIVFKPMLEKSSTATSYEPYTNGASPNPDYPQNIEVVTGEQDIQVCGKNFANYNLLFGDTSYYTINGDNITILQPDNRAWITLDGTTWGIFLKAGQYVFSYNANSSGQIQIWGKNSGQLARVVLTTGYVAINLTQDDIVGCKFLNISSFPYDAGKIQIENGTQASTYEAYKGNTYEINLGKNLFDYENTSFNNNSTGTTTKTSEYVKAVPNTTSNYSGFYVANTNLPNITTTSLSFKAKADSSRTINVSYFNKTTTISLTTSWQTFKVENATHNSNTLDFYSGTDHSGTAFYIKDIQTEKGSVATSYSHYRSYTKNLFGDTIRQGVTNYQTGEYSSNSSRVTSTNWTTLEEGTYTINVESTNSNPLQISCVTFDTSGNFYNISGVSGQWKTLPLTFTTPIPIKWKCNLSYSNGASITPSNVKNIQLEKGSQKTSYVPYMSQIELCKIGNYQDYIKRSSGKNLFDFNMEQGTISGQDGSTSASTSRIRTVNYINVEPSTTYTLSLPTPNMQMFIFTYKEDNTFIERLPSSWGTPPCTFTTSADTRKLKFILSFTNSATITPSDVSNVMLEKNNEATTYEPYGTNWYVCKNIGKVVLNGSESGWAGGSVATNVYRYYRAFEGILAFTDSNRHIDRHISNYFRRSTNNEYGATYQYQSALYFCVSSNEATTLADFKTWLSTHNTTVYYVLNTPTYIGIEDEELINQLESIRLLNGLNNVIISSPYLPAIMNLHYNFNEAYYYMNQLFFSGVVKNSGNISLNPREPHFQTLQILDFKTFLSEGETLDRVIVNKTILETIQEVVGVISGYGFVLGNVQIANPDDIIGAYSTENKTAYDIFNYIAEITQSKWTTRLIDENTVAIDFYDPSALPQGTPIEYNTTYFKDNLIDNMFYSYSSNDYRNKQIMTSKEVFANIDTKETIISSGYGNTFLVEQPIGQIESIKLNNVEMSSATKQDKELGYSADFYYSVGSNSIESDINIPLGSSIVIQYIPIVSGRQVISNDSEISRISGSTGRNGIITRYENRNDASTSTELQMIGQSYIKYKGSPEIKLTVETRSNLWEIGERVQFNAPIPELATEYMVKSKKIQYIPTIDEIFYTFEMSSSFNSEQDINYFDNQRAKAQGNIKEGSYISRNIDIENVANITFQNVSIEKINSTGDNKLNSTLNSPIVQ